MKKFFVVLFLLLLSEYAHSWEALGSRPTRTPCNTSTPGNLVATSCRYAELNCRISDDTFSSCDISDPTASVNNWINEQQGSGYAYMVGTSISQTENSWGTPIVRFSARVYRMFPGVDEHDFPEFHDDDGFSSGSPPYNVERSDESCSSSIDGAGIFAVPDGSTSFNDQGCSYTATSSVTCWESDNSPTGHYCMADWDAVSSGEKVLPPSGDGFSSPSTDFDSSRPPYMTRVSSCSNLDACMVVDGQAYSIDEDAVSSGSISIVGGSGSPSDPFWPGSDGSSAPTYGDGSTGGSDGSGGSNGGSTGGSSGGAGAGDGGGFGEDAWGDFLGDGWGDGMGGEGAGGAGGNEPGVPVESVDIQEAAVDWSSGLSTSGTCPAPQEVDVLGQSLSFSYEPFCDLASYIRALILAAAYISAAFLVFRGLT